MIVIGALLLVLGCVAYLVARGQATTARAAAETETFPCADLAFLAGDGMFRQRCEVVGAAAPGENGLLKAPESGVEAVWHRTRILRRYWEIEEQRDGEGRTTRTRVERERVVSDISSATPFVVADATGQVVIAPAGAEVDRPEQVVDRFEPCTGLRHEEWVIRPGARLYVRGEASDASGRLAFAEPEQGRYLISTRSEEEIVASAHRLARLGSRIGVVAGIAGGALVFAGLLS